MLKITVAQLNFTVGDIEGNVGAMIEAARQAALAGSVMVVFSELAVTGYHPGDLLEEPAFLDRVAQGLARLQQASRQLPELHWVVGAPLPRQGPGKPLENAVWVLRGGLPVLRYAKQLLPTYGIFDERRHFEPGPDQAAVLRIGTLRVGLLICEDGWNDDGSAYAVNPFSRLAEAAPDLVVALNASPSHLGKRRQRHEVFGQAARRLQLPLLYVNQVGGQDALVFDGASFVLNARGQVCFEAPRFVAAVVTLQFSEGQFVDPQGHPLPAWVPEPEPASAFYRAQIVLGLRDYARRCGFERVVVGCSGGIDSALTLALAVEALGPEAVHAVTLPSAWSSEGSVSDSVALCRALGVALFQHPIADLVAGFGGQFQASFGVPLAGLPLENLQARVRGTVLMAHSNHFGGLLLTTGNKSEISVGYCTLYGDTNGGLGLLGDLYKTEVFALAQHLNDCAGRPLIPQAILDKPPSAELAPGQLDTDSLPPYPVLDEVLKVLIEAPGASADTAAELQAARQFVAQLVQTPAGAACVQRIRSLVARNEYKRRQAPPLIRVRPRAFGTGRQLPIAARLI